MDRVISLGDLNDIKLPYVIKDVNLFVPGVHNGVTFSDREIHKTFQTTNWNDKRVCSLYNDHRDDWAVDPRKPWAGKSVHRGANVQDYTGSVRNVRLVDDRIVGDLYVIDPVTAIKLAFEDTKFGISPSGHWKGDYSSAKDFIIRNFAIVVNPAIKQNYIENSDRQLPIYNFAMESEMISVSSVAELAMWDTKYVNDLPDSSFAYISPGGQKDADGKTIPRTLRHLPYKDIEGKVDADHVRNALARLNQTQIPESAKAEAKTKLLSAAKGVGIKSNEGEDKMEFEELKSDIEGMIKPLTEKVANLAGDVEAIKKAKDVEEKEKIEAKQKEEQLMAVKKKQEDEEKEKGKLEEMKKKDEEIAALKSKLEGAQKGAEVAVKTKEDTKEEKDDDDEYGNKEFAEFLSKLGTGI